jgi:glycosyltransferase involved in cell wall biosynthesis
MGKSHLTDSKCYRIAMLNYMIDLYYRMPLFLQDFLNPLGLRFHDFLVNTFYDGFRKNRIFYIPYHNKKSSMDIEYMQYRHKRRTPSRKRQFKNCFFPNDYTLVQEKASLWTGKPSLNASIIVASYNQKDTLQLNLLAWTQQTYPLDLIEVIVADDGSSDGTVELVNDLKTQLPYSLKFYTQEDKGFRLAKIRNEGVAMSNGEVVLFVDSDTIPSREYIWEHMKYYHVSDNVAVVGMRHRIKNNITQDDILDKHKLDLLKQLPMIEDPNTPWYMKKWRKEVLFNNVAFRRHWNAWGGFHGTLTSCRREDYISVGGHDESFTVYGQEDTEMGYRLLSKVQYLISNPKARLFHLEHPSNSHLINPKNIEILNERTRGPKVTVYITAYNSEANIEEAIKSVLTQTLQDYELIIVNDGSTDNTDSILRQYKYHPKIRLYNQTHKGTGAASNLALLYSRGEYICPLHQDDLLMPNTLKVLSSELEESDTIGLVYAGHYEVINGEEVPARPEVYHPGSFIVNKITLPMMWKRGYFYLTEGFNQDVSSYFEYDVALKLEELSGVKELELVLYKSRLKFEAPTSTRNYDLITIINSALKRRGVKLILALDGEVIFFTNRTLVTNGTLE